MNKKISIFLREITQQLSPYYDTANQDAKSIICDVLGVDTTYLYINNDNELSESQILDVQEKADKYIAGKPLAYILGYKHFWEQKLLVNEHTLIPRADTEVLIESVLSDFSDTKLPLTILDLGTGTGAIALALAGEYPNAKVTAIDFSDNALEIAKQNTKLNNITNVEFIQSDWYKSLDTQKFDIIVSNPPYIDEHDVEMEGSVVKYEPKTALVAANHGLADIEIIVSQSCKYLKPNGSLYIEHGHLQGESVRDVFTMNGFTGVQTIQDLNAKDRVTKGLLFS